MKNKEPKNKFSDLKTLIEIWAKEKGILDKATPVTQQSKTIEEVEELGLALLHQEKGSHTFTVNGKKMNTEHEIKDAIGDIIVTLIIQSKMQGLDIVDCLQMAYDVISKRKGKMINGVFVKEKLTAI